MKSFRTVFLLVIWIVSPLSIIGQSTIATSSKVRLTVENSSLTKLENLLTSSTWTVTPSSLYEVLPNAGTLLSDMEVLLDAKPDELQQIKLTLKIKNKSSKKIQIATVFPNIIGLHYPLGLSRDLYYLYPQEGLAHHNSNFKSEQIYSRWFPLQFIDVYHRTRGGFYVMTNDTTNYPKKYFFEKSNGKTTIKITFNTKEINPGETWELPPVVIGAHRGDWHDAFFAYRDWVKTWYKPTSPRKTWFQDIYNFRQVFLHTNFGERGVWEPITKKVELLERINEDKKVFGAIDYVHIFDWMREPEDRIFNYNPWGYLGGYETLKAQIDILKSQGIRTGLYFQGYKLHRESDMGIANGNQWQMLDPQGIEYGEKGYHYPCPSASDWQNYFTDVAKETTSKLNTDGVYFDQYGFGYLTNYYGCYNPLHNHPVIEGPVSSNYMGIGETQMLLKARNKIGNDKVLYVEEMPTDVSTQYLDGSFTYAVNKSKFSAGTKMNPSSLNLFRFAFPGFKTFEMLKVDTPIGEDTIGVKNIFFNGEGIWIEGPLNDSGWFPESVRKLIRKTHTILSNNKEAFRSADAVPLVPTLNTNVYSNYFPSARKNVWTFYNTSDIQHSGTIIRVPHISGAMYYDGWNFKQIYPAVVNNMAEIDLQIKGKDAGCLIQTLDPLNMVLPADPIVEAKKPELSINMTTTRLSGSTVSFRLSAGGTGSVYIDWGDGNLIEYAGSAMSSNVSAPTVLFNTITTNSPSIKIYTKDRYITYLDCNGNDLNLLNVDSAPMIQYLRCYNNKLTELNLTNNQELIILQCYSNQLTRLDVSNSIKLAELLCNANKISSLNITGLEILKTLSAMVNPLGSIDLSTNRSLRTLNLRNASLTSLDVSKNPLISSIEIFNTGPTNANNFSACALDSLYLSLPDKSGMLSGALRVIYNQNNPLGNNVTGSNKDIAKGKNWIVSSSAGEVLSGDGGECMIIPRGVLSISMQSEKLAGETVTLKLTASNPDGVLIDWGNGVQERLTGLSVNSGAPTTITRTLPVDNPVIKISVDRCYVSVLDCSNNGLTSLDLSGTATLFRLTCNNNKLTELDISRQTKLTHLICQKNQIASLDVSKNVVLDYMEIWENKITVLTGLKNTSVSMLSMRVNPIYSIDVTGITTLKTLYVQNCGLTSLDVTGCANLTTLSINNVGPILPNNFNACALDTLYESLPLVAGTLTALYSGTEVYDLSDVNGSNKTIATEKGWTVKSLGSTAYTGDGNGCMPSGSYNLKADLFTLSPNPTNDFVIIKVSENAQNTNLYLYDYTGKLLFKDIILSEKTLNISQFDAGVYFVKIDNQVEKLIINR